MNYGVPHPAARELLDLYACRRIVTVEMPGEATTADEQRAAASILAGHADAVLLGDASRDTVQLPPSLRASILAYEGVRLWASLSGDDRNRVALESELLGLCEVGVGAVHCVTGDQPVFDLDSTRLTRLAAGRGMLVSVAQAPAETPVPEPARRVALEVAAGADVCFVGHAPHDVVAEFIAQAHELAPSLRFMACVPLATSPAGLERLGARAGGSLPRGLATAVQEVDPVGGAVRASLAEAAALLDLPGIAGIHFTPAAGPGEQLRVAAALSLAADELGGGA